MNLPRTLTLSAEMRKAIDAQGRQDYPHETCGFLLGEASGETLVVRRILAAANRHSENPRRFYEIDREGYGHAESAAMGAGLNLLGIYHTHPDSPPHPSSTDATYAFPEWVYWITPVANGVPGDPRIWYRTWNPEAWRELDCVVTGEER